MLLVLNAMRCSNSHTSGCVQRLGILLLALFAGADTLSAELGVSPTRISLSGGNIRDVLRVRNNGDSAISVEARSFLWGQDDNAVDKLERSRDLILVPPVFRVAPGDTQLIRVGFRNPPATKTESSYRILLTEIPGEESPGASMILRISLPLFYTPKEAKPETSWSLYRSKDHAMRLVINNVINKQGGAHVLINRVALYASEDDKKPLWDSKGLLYILPGSSRQWDIALPKTTADQAKTTADQVLTLEIDQYPGQTIRTNLSLQNE